jgi:hypothetical protein
MSLSSTYIKTYKTHIKISSELEDFLEKIKKINNTNNNLPKMSNNEVEISHFIQYLNELNLIDFPSNNFYYRSS